VAKRVVQVQPWANFGFLTLLRTIVVVSKAVIGILLDDVQHFFSHHHIDTTAWACDMC
jgi:selenocysteine lyase/cysteine desulfurase